jgi:metal-responsive CopG/Arc/MetJ family transcriptional regulator
MAKKKKKSEQPILSVKLDPDTVADIDKVAKRDGHTSRGAVIRKALTVFLHQEKEA